MQRGSDFPGSGKPAAPRLWSVTAWALLAVFSAELALFWTSTRRHIAWVYPRWFDQLQYLREAYGGYDRMRAGGFIEGAGRTLSTVSPQGSLHGFLALLAFSAAGPTRNAALAVNLFAFLALQAAMFLAVRRVSGSFAFAWAALGLLAALRSPWSDSAGSAADFRLDWMAACAYGVALAAAVSGNGFRSTRWAVVFGVAVAVALLVRHLTAVYFGVICLGLLAGLLGQPDRLSRCGRLLLSGSIAIGISGWAFWRSWGNIYRYYWVVRFVGPESALRDSHMRMGSYARWLSSELLFHQIGAAAALLGLAAGAAFAASARAARRREGADLFNLEPVRAAWPAVLLFLAAPAAVLMIHPEKAPQPLNIMIPAATWVIVLVWMRLARRTTRFAVVATCAAVGSAGAALFAGAQLANPIAPDMESEYREINALADFLYFRAEEAGLSRPRVAVTRIFDGLGAELFEVLGRERHGTTLPFVATLPTGLVRDVSGDVMARLGASDFVCLVTRAGPSWPFDREMESMLPEMRSWCEANMRHDGDLDTVEFSVSVYESRSLAPARAGRGVDLAALISASAVGPAFAPAPVPEAPVITAPPTVFWTTAAEFRYVVRAAYSPVTFHAQRLPEGIRIAPGGEMRGYFPSTGRFSAAITAENARGSAAADVTFLVSDQPWDAAITPPGRARIGVPVEIGYCAFDSRGTLDFIDVTDLTTARFVDRLSANDDERRNWQGSFRLTLREPGRHRIKMRFVRYDPEGAGAYTFLDREYDAQAVP